jgi:hypothetical protein
VIADNASVDKTLVTGIPCILSKSRVIVNKGSKPHRLNDVLLRVMQVFVICIQERIKVIFKHKYDNLCMMDR